MVRNRAAATTTPPPKQVTLRIDKLRKPLKDVTVNNAFVMSTMADRFVQSISQINDSASFDTSFEVKHIQAASPQRVRHRCITELDRANVLRFLQDYERRQQFQRDHLTSPPKSPPKHKTIDSNATSPSKLSPYLCRKAKAIYENAFVRCGTPPKDNGDDQGIYEEIAQNPQHMCVDHKQMTAPVAPHGNAAFRRAQPERASLRSAAKVLNFFAGKKKYAKCSGSPDLGCQPLAQRQPEDGDYAEIVDDEHDDGISTASSNFTQSSGSQSFSPDSSFEMQPPLLPTYKLTPPQPAKKANGAVEMARNFFLRGSFHAKRANVTRLRRSISDPNSLEDIDFTKPCKRSSLKKVQEAVLADRTNCNGVACPATNSIRVSHF